MIINLIYDSSVAGAPASFKTDVAAVAQFLDSLIANPITININVGYGEIDGQALGSGDLGESEENTSNFSYTQIKAALTANATSAADLTAVGTLPGSSPFSRSTFTISQVEAVALGLLPAATVAQGWVGFSKTTAFDYDDSNGVTAGQSDFLGVVAHEITEVLGRFSGYDVSSNNYSILDLFRYSAPGVRSTASSHTAYFSIDGGVTNLGNFNTDPSGDFGDWADSVGNNAFLAFGSSGVVDPVTQNDLTELNILGYQLASLAVTSIVTSPATGAAVAGQAVTITVDFNLGVTVAGGTPTLTLNDGAIATYDSRASTSTALVFDYTVGANDRTPNLAIVAVNEPAGTTVTDATGRTVNLPGLVAGVGTGLGIGTVTNNTIVGGPGSDVFYALATNLTFSGGGGHDTIVFDGPSSQYTIAANGDGSVTVADSLVSRDGSHRLLGVEDLQFTDKVVFVENSDNANLARLYAAAFARPPDVGGLDFWEDVYANNIPASAKTNATVALAETNPTGMTTSIANAFIGSAEFQQDYGVGVSDTVFLTHLYQNALGRAPDTGGLNFWLGFMQSGEAAGDPYVKAEVLLNFAESPENIARTAAVWLFQV